MKNYFIPFFICVASSLFAQEVSIYKTDANGNDRLLTLNSIQFSNGTISDENSLTINQAQFNQSVEGFGYTLTNGSAELLMKMNQAKRTELLEKIYDPVKGINSSVIRIPLGACDLASSLYTYNDTPNNFNMSAFNFGPDASHLLPVLKEIKKINPNVKLLATPWSAPLWMKTENKWDGGMLRNDMLGTYAIYLKTYLQKMHDEGLQIWALSIQNEPQNPYNHPAMLMPASQQIDFIENHLKDELSDLNFSRPIIIGFDHNIDIQGQEYAKTIGNNSDYLDGIAFHYYNNSHGNKGFMTTLNNETAKDIYFTEQYTPSGEGFNSQFGWHMEHVVIGALRNRSKTVFNWNLAADENDLPTTHPDVCKDCGGAATLTNNDYTLNTPYYIIGQLSKFTDPGAVVLQSSALNNAINDFSVALKNPDGTIVVCFFNVSGDSNSTIHVNFNNKSFSHSVAPRSAVTFKWKQAFSNAPLTPTNLSVIENKNRAYLNWEIVTDASVYEVSRATSIDGPFNTIATNLVNTNYIDTEITFGQPYFYKIRAKNTVGNSEFSKVVSINASEEVDTDFIQILPDGTYIIRNNNINQVITTPLENNYNGGPYDAFLTDEDTADEFQLWEIAHIGNDTYTFKNKGSNLYLGSDDNPCNRFSNIYGGISNQDQNQQFKIVATQGNNYAVQYALEKNCTNTLGNAIQAWDVDGGLKNGQLHTFDLDINNTNQQFEFVEVSTTLSTNSNLFFVKNEFSIYPNPASKQINITAKNNKLQGNVTVYDIKGKEILRKQLNNTKHENIDLMNLSKGVYFIKLPNRTMKKFIKI